VIRLNLGCGPDLRDGYTNVDFRAPEQLGPGAYVHHFQQVDLSSFPWPWEDDSVDEVMMLDFLEHFPRHRTQGILQECRRILRKGGVLVVQVPDMEITCQVIAGIGDVPCNRCERTFDEKADGRSFCRNCGHSRTDMVDAAFARMYGGQDYEGNYHMAGFTPDTLRNTLERNMFVGVTLLEVDHQRRNWNVKMTARKF
jgi:predicted SAM-dependent methyltransferase